MTLYGLRVVAQRLSAERTMSKLPPECVLTQASYVSAIPHTMLVEYGLLTKLISSSGFLSFYEILITYSDRQKNRSPAPKFFTEIFIVAIFAHMMIYSLAAADFWLHYAVGTLLLPVEVPTTVSYSVGLNQMFLSNTRRKTALLLYLEFAKASLADPLTLVSALFPNQEEYHSDYEKNSTVTGTTQSGDMFVDTPETERRYTLD
ncbi:hypothetical protein BOTBODRAFT_43896 [Botryobasidium botryosum FD-172 SS1]|uniref:Uncharacterized protein n=1 Tax=Botryobasidium botryosum (strain FD-172 SS1) TaxID=930990 RepID=A0A067MIF3_BOTB1|nr:hypothetical protein BOTBODRAFT_43896 [Botryobasidium botryosum FD-172 SS1]